MISYEIERVFLTESMIVGLFGGLIGLIVGFLLGKFIGLVLTLVSLDKGLGFIDVAYIPTDFVLVVLVLSLFVGVLTGIYPARRAKKISALNALRYE
jgi:ABC-type antimicrobial peptide transport system permease subunit